LTKVGYDLGQRHRVQDPIHWHAALSRHLDTPVHVVELGDRVGVRIDAHHAAELDGRLVPAPIQIEPPWVGVNLDDDVMLGARVKDILGVDFAAWPPLEPSPADSERNRPPFRF
jgi:hypothetical protein